MTATLEGLRCPPKWLWVPPHVTTYGPEVADLCAAVGQAADPEQRLFLDAAYAVDETGRLVATEFACAAPRQNIKTFGGKACSLADLVLFRVPDCLWTAHLRDTAYDAFRNDSGTGLADLFEAFDWLRRLVHEIKDSDGERSITLRSKSAGEPKPSLSFVTRSERGGRGLSGRRVTFDEALFLKPAHTAAMLPILSARSMSGQVQARYLGSPGLLSSQSWRDIRDKGRAGNARAMAYLEWGATRVPCAQEDCSHRFGEVEGCALDREDLVREANLAVDRRIDIRFVMQVERERLTPVDYMRERMGWWEDPPTGNGILDLDLWAALAKKVGAPSNPAMSIEVALDRQRAWIGAAWNVGGRRHVEIVEDRAGADWAVPRLRDLRANYSIRSVAVDMGTEAKSLIPDLESAGFTVVKVAGDERPAACSGFTDSAISGRLSHDGDPAIVTAIRNARWKDVGEGTRVFSRRRSAGPIGELYAVALALHALGTGPDPDRLMF